MKTTALVLLVPAVLALVGLWVFVRLAPSSVARWHVDPANPDLHPHQGAFLLRHDGDMQSPVYPETADALLMRAHRVIRDSPRTRVLAGGLQNGHITYVTRSKLWGFPDYSSIKAQSVEGGAALVIYARLRFGKSDLGVNRARVQNWLADLSP